MEIREKQQQEALRREAELKKQIEAKEQEIKWLEAEAKQKKKKLMQESISKLATSLGEAKRDLKLLKKESELLVKN